MWQKVCPTTFHVLPPNSKLYFTCCLQALYKMGTWDKFRGFRKCSVCRARLWKVFPAGSYGTISCCSRILLSSQLRWLLRPHCSRCKLQIVLCLLSTNCPPGSVRPWRPLGLLPDMFMLSGNERRPQTAPLSLFAFLKTETLKALWVIPFKKIES